MIKMLSTALLLFPLFAVAADPAFEAGASFGKGNAAAGTGALKIPARSPERYRAIPRTHRKRGITVV